jgi:hypothetical protein
MQKWEYLAVGNFLHRAEFEFYNSHAGATVEKVSGNNEFKKRVAELGEEGWELVTSHNRDWLFYKRPKE